VDKFTVIICDKAKLDGYRLVNGKLTYKVEISGPDHFSTTNYYDVKSGLKLQSTGESVALGGTVTFGDYNEVKGIKFPFSIEGSTGNIKMRVQDIKMNTGLMKLSIE